METPILKTVRLEIVPLSEEQLAWYLDDYKKFSRKVGKTSRVILTETLIWAIRMKLEKMANMDPGDHAWITYWLIRLKESGFGIGMLGYKGIPDYMGQVEIGYGIDPGHQNKGYTTEAARRLIQWAFEDNCCQRIIAPGTRKDNIASNRVLEKLGMKIYQETKEGFGWVLDRRDYLTSPE